MTPKKDTRSQVITQYGYIPFPSHRLLILQPIRHNAEPCYPPRAFVSTIPNVPHTQKRGFPVNYDSSVYSSILNRSTDNGVPKQLMPFLEVAHYKKPQDLLSRLHSCYTWK